jgi:transcriptional regulator with XRE-family HTH domain
LDLSQLGATLQKARKEQELTVGELSQRAQVSSGLISQLERGRGNPSFLTLSRLAEALRVPLGHFLQDAPRGPSGMVVRADQRKKLVLPEDHLVYELLTPNLSGSLEVLRTQVPAGWTNRERPFVHPGEECVHLLSGCLQVTVGEDYVELDEGDSITFDSSVPHWWTNASRASAVIIGSVTPPSF